MSTLYIVATPIGNLEDITLRAIRVLFEVDVIAAEDTRRSGVLLEYLRKREDLLASVFSKTDSRREGKPRFISVHDNNEQQRVDEVLGLLRQGKDIALISDAGTPLVSDPGFRIVRAVREAGMRVVSIPGPVAWVSALVTSGMPTNMVWAVGYLPLRSKRRQKELRQLVEAAAAMKKNPTLVFYEAPHRLLSTLRDVLEVMGNVEVVLAAELTKLHEKVSKNSVSLWIAELQKEKKIKGEYTVLVELKGGEEIADEEE